MPYSSDAQRRWAHTDSAKKAGFPTEEFDETSKGKKLPETAPKKMAEGGPVVTDQSQGDEFTDGIKSGMNHDLNSMKQAIADFVEKIHGNYIQGMGDTGNLKGLQNVMNGLQEGTTQPTPIDTSDGQFMGEINVGVSPQKMAEGGFPTGDEDLPGFDVNTNTSSLKMGNNPASVTPQPPVPTFNSQAGLPPLRLQRRVQQRL